MSVEVIIRNFTIGGHSKPGFLLCRGSRRDYCQDTKTAKAYAIEDMVRSMPFPPTGSEWKQLSDVLEEDEMLEWFLSAEYDDRLGVNVTSGQNRVGML